MPQNTQTIEAALEGADLEWKPKGWEMGVRTFRELGFDKFDVFKPEQVKLVISAIVLAAMGTEARDYHRREIIADGFIYDPENERIYDLVADALPPARPPATDLIDGFDFEGMDWGEDEKPAA